MVHAQKLYTKHSLPGKVIDSLVGQHSLERVRFGMNSCPTKVVVRIGRMDLMKAMCVADLTHQFGVSIHSLEHNKFKFQVIKKVFEKMFFPFLCLDPILHLWQIDVMNGKEGSPFQIL